LRSGDVLEGIEVVRIMSHIVGSIHKRKVYKGRLPCISMVKQIVIRVDDDLFKKAQKKKERHSDTWEDVVKFYVVMRGGE